MIYDEKYYFDLRQETIYWNSSFLDKKWYRKLFGGKWYYLDLCKNFNVCIWTKRPDWFSGYKKTIKTEEYPETRVDTKIKLYKLFIKTVII